MLLNLESCLGEVFNISGDEYVTSNQIIKELVRILDRQAVIGYLPYKEIIGKLEPLVEGDWHDLYSNRKVKLFLGNYQINSRLSEYIQQSVEFYFQHPQ